MLSNIEDILDSIIEEKGIDFIYEENIKEVFDYDALLDTFQSMPITELQNLFLELTEEYDYGPIFLQQIITDIESIFGYEIYSGQEGSKLEQVIFPSGSR